MPRGDKPLGEQKCPVCQRSNVAEINIELAQGIAVTTLAVRHKINLRQLYRHKEEHLLTDKYSGGLLVVSIRDIMDIPNDMKERRELQHALVERLIEPLTREHGLGIDAVQWAFLVNVWKLMMADEQTVMRVTGVLRDGHTVDGADTQAQIGNVRARIEEVLRRMIDEGGMPAEKAKAAISYALDPNPQLLIGSGMGTGESETTWNGSQEQAAETSMEDVLHDWDEYTR